MDKHSILDKLSKEEDKLFISKVLDKFNYSINKNKISSTNFINLAEKELAKKVLSRLKVNNFMFYGAYEDCQRCVILFYPEKFDKSIVEANYNTLLGIIRIKLPKELEGIYSHKDYLGAIMKLGVNREKVGDILVFENGADIIVSKDILEFLYSNLSSLTRFQKSIITIETVENLRIIESKKEDIQIIIPSLRLDSIVSELTHTSRSKACDIIASERVFVNFVSVTKSNTLLKGNDTLTIRRNGKYTISQVLGNTRKGNIILKLEKYI